MRMACLSLAAALLAPGAFAQAADVEDEVRSVVSSIMKTCWDGVADLPEPDTLRVRITVILNPDGSVSSKAVITPAQTFRMSEATKTAIERAKAAIDRCEPFALPPEHYDTWKRITLDFGPAPVPGV